jgi:hypothetical protein
MLFGFTITSDQRTPRSGYRVWTQSLTSLLGMQRFAIPRIELTHREGRSAVIVHLGRASKGYRCGAVTRGAVRNGDYNGKRMRVSKGFREETGSCNSTFPGAWRGAGSLDSLVYRVCLVRRARETRQICVPDRLPLNRHPLTQRWTRPTQKSRMSWFPSFQVRLERK